MEQASCVQLLYAENGLLNCVNRKERKGSLTLTPYTINMSNLKAVRILQTDLQGISQVSYHINVSHSLCGRPLTYVHTEQTESLNH